MPFVHSNAMIALNIALLGLVFDQQTRFTIYELHLNFVCSQSLFLSFFVCLLLLVFILQVFMTFFISSLF